MLRDDPPGQRRQAARSARVVPSLLVEGLVIAGADLALLEAAARAAGEIALGVRRAARRGAREARRPRAGQRGRPRRRPPAARAPAGRRGPATAGCPRRARTARRRLGGGARVFVVDPIDGTRAFLAGQQAWALSLAVVEARPADRRRWCTCRRSAAPTPPRRGGGARLNGAPIACAGARRDRRRARARPAQPLDPSLWPGGAPRGRAPLPPVARLPALPGGRGPLRRRALTSATPGSGTSPPAT